MQLVSEWALSVGNAKAGKWKDKKAVWVEVEMPVRGRRYDLHTQTHTGSVFSALRLGCRACALESCGITALCFCCLVLAM